MSDYDSPWKEALDEFFEPFLELLFPAAHADIDWTRGYESLDKELQQSWSTNTCPTLHHPNGLVWKKALHEALRPY
jgi:1,2-phenylacetyl-CoA epoxidase catalytic subunit